MVPLKKSKGGDTSISEYELGFIVIDGKLYIGKYKDIGEERIKGDEASRQTYKVKSNGVSVWDTDRWFFTYEMDVTPVVLPDIGKPIKALKKEYEAQDGTIFRFSQDSKTWEVVK